MKKPIRVLYISPVAEKKHINDNYSMNRMIDRIENLYTEIVSK